MSNKVATRAKLDTQIAKLEVVKTKTDAMQSKVDFISSLAHDTGSPLFVVDAIVIRLTEVGSQIPAITPCLSIMSLCVSMLKSARQRSMDCARSKNGDYEKPKLQPVELFPLLRDLNGMVNLFMSQRSVQFIFQLESYLTTNRIYSSPEWVSNMILNFINNANKYTDSGTIVVSVYRVSEGCGICFEVADTGPGIESKYKIRLFDKFVRVETIKAEEMKEKGNDLMLQQIDQALDLCNDTDSSPNSSIGTPTMIDRFRSFFPGNSSVLPYVVGNVHDTNLIDEKKASLNSPTDFESPMDVTPLNSKKEEVKGTGLGLFGVLMKAVKFGGYVGIQDNIPQGAVFSFTIPHYSLTRDMVKLDKGSMERIASILPRIGANDSGVCLPPPNPNRLGGIAFVQITGAIDASGMDFDIETQTIIQQPLQSTARRSSGHSDDDGPQLISIPHSMTRGEAGDSKSRLPKEDQSNWPSILVIDDSSSVRMAWVGAMRRKKYKVVECENGEQGVAAMKGTVFPFVVTDMQMPKFDGIQTTTAIREYERTMNKTGKDRQVIIFCSGGVDDELRGRAMSAGADIISDKACSQAALFDEAMKFREGLNFHELK